MDIAIRSVAQYLTKALDASISVHGGYFTAMLDNFAAVVLDRVDDAQIEHDISVSRTDEDWRRSRPRWLNRYQE